MWLWKQKSSVTLNYSTSINLNFTVQKSIPCYLSFTHIYLIKATHRVVSDPLTCLSKVPTVICSIFNANTDPKGCPSCRAVGKSVLFVPCLPLMPVWDGILWLLVTWEGVGSEIQVGMDILNGCFHCQEMAVKNEVGLINNPLKVSWLEGQPQNNPSTVPPDSSGEPKTSQVRRHNRGCCYLNLFL